MDKSIDVSLFLEKTFEYLEKLKNEKLEITKKNIEKK